MRIVLDTNIILASAYHKSKYNIIFESLLDNKFQLYLTTEIYFEYREKLEQIFNTKMAGLIIGTLKKLPNVLETKIFYNLNLITNDPDDNKFVDCAFAAKVDYLVTNDKHFNVLKETNFPQIKIINIHQFIEIIESYL